MTEIPQYEDPQLQASAIKMHQAEVDRVNRIEHAYQDALTRFSATKEYELCHRLIRLIKIADALLVVWVILMVALAICGGAVVMGLLNISTKELIMLIAGILLVVVPFLLWRFWARGKCKRNIRRIVEQWVQVTYPGLVSEEGVTVAPAAIVDIMMK